MMERLLKNIAPWLTGDGPEAEIVFSSRLRLARNLEGHNFSRRLTPDLRRRLAGEIEDGVRRAEAVRDPLVFRLEEVEPLDRLFLLERHLISRELSPEGQGGVMVGGGEVVSLMINEEDHIRVQVIRSGLSLEQAWEEIDRVDSRLERVLPFATADDLGYLTACPSNVGTGMRASVMMHLPGLVLQRQIGKIIQALGKLGLAARGLYGEGSPASGNIFQVSNQATLGKSEREIVCDLDRIVKKIIVHERTSRRQLLDRRPLKLEDQIFRARSILGQARLITSEEAIGLLSLLRMGVDLGILEAIPRRTLNQIFIQSQPAHLQKLAGSALTPEKRDALRARLIRERLAQTRKEEGKNV